MPFILPSSPISIPTSITHGRPSQLQHSWKYLHTFLVPAFPALPHLSWTCCPCGPPSDTQDTQWHSAPSHLLTFSWPVPPIPWDYPDMAVRIAASCICGIITTYSVSRLPIQHVPALLGPTFLPTTVCMPAWPGWPMIHYIPPFSSDILHYL